MFIKQKVFDIYHGILSKKDKQKVDMQIRQGNFQKVKNIKPKQVKKICFVIKEIRPMRGGITSVLRLGTGLANRDYQIVYAVLTENDINKTKEAAKINLEGYKGEIINFSTAKKKQFDIVIATGSDTVALVNVMNGYKMYFVQDYEPYFYVYGDLFLLAKKTYELGLHIVTLGTWNKEMIKKNCYSDSIIDSIDFPYEPSEYKLKKRDYKKYSDKKELSVAVYIKMNGRRIPYIWQYMLGDLQKRLNEYNNIKLNILYFGEDTWFKCDYGKNLGKLSKKELRKLYETVDFGAVASLTNISLVPYEMIATGLPILETKEGSFTYFFDNKSAILLGLDVDELYQEFISYIKEPEKIEQMVKHANKLMANVSWDKSIGQFNEILQNL